MKLITYSIIVSGLLFATQLCCQSVKLDTSFNHTGIVRSVWGTGGERISSLAMQNDGKIIAAGEVTTGINFRVLVQRYLTDGSLDPSFGKKGIALSEILGGTYASSHAYAVSIQKDGKIVVTGLVSEAGINSILISRFLQNGSVDSSFNSLGYLIIKSGSNSSANAIKILTDGSILVAGTTIYNTKNSFFAFKCSQAGVPDSNFGTNGMSVLPVGNGHSYCYALELLTDGSMVLGGYAHNGTNNDFAVVKLKASGTPDSSFSQDGKILIDFNKSQDYGIALAIQKDGKFVVGGQSYESNQNHFALIRLHSSGDLDTSFSHDGKLITHINNSASDIRALALQDDGKIIAIGVGSGKDAATTKSDFAIARYLTDGNLDMSFGGTGIITQDYANAANVPLAVLPFANKSILLGGYSLINSNSDIMLYQIHSDGTSDSSFNKTGLLIQDLDLTHSFANSIYIQADGKLVLGGYCNYYESYEYFSARYELNGKIDSSYSNDGVAIRFFSQDQDICRALAIQNDGKILQLGTSINNAGLSSIMLLRYAQDGSTDNSFDSDGKVTTTASADGSEGNCLLLQKDQKILVGGTLFEGSNGNFALLRYLSSGKPDSSFGINGITTTDFNSGMDEAKAIGLQEDGKILLAGSSTLNGTSFFSIARYAMDGTPDLSFNQNGKILLNFGQSNVNIAKVIKLQKDGKILIGGYTYNKIGNHLDFALARLNADGSLDLTFSGDGMLTLNVNNQSNEIEDLLLFGNGEILIAGNTSSGNSFEFVTVLLHPDGSINTSYGDKGVAYFNLGSNKSVLTSAAVQSDGKVLLCGYTQDEFKVTAIILRLSLNLQVKSNDFQRPECSSIVFPNPVVHSFSLQYTLDKNSRVSIKLVDLQGREICHYLNQTQRSRGFHIEEFEIPENLASGTYMLINQTSEGVQSILLNH